MPFVLDTRSFMLTIEHDREVRMPTDLQAPESVRNTLKELSKKILKENTLLLS